MTSAARGACLNSSRHRPVLPIQPRGSSRDCGRDASGQLPGCRVPSASELG